jgi:hypothetical protein
MTGTLSWQDLALIIVGLAAAGLVKGAVGLGTPIVAVPVMAKIIGLANAIAMMAAPMVITNSWQIWQYRAERQNAGPVLPLLVAATIGIFFGTMALVQLDEHLLFIALGVLLLAYVVIFLLKPSLAIPRRAAWRMAPFVGLATGVLQGSTGVSAPVSLTFLHALRWSREGFVFAGSAIFFVCGAAQALSLALAGVLTGRLLLLSLIAVIPIVAFMKVGTLIGSRMSKPAFERLVLALLCVVGARMLWLGVA